MRTNSPGCHTQVRGELSREARLKVNTLIITDVHARDVIDRFVRDSVMAAREFAWESQLRFYWDKGMVGVEVAVLCSTHMGFGRGCEPRTCSACETSHTRACCSRTTWPFGSARAASSMATSSWASTAALSSPP
jgi:hypothetical protein